jgi:uncharacterized protein
LNASSSAPDAAVPRFQSLRPWLLETFGRPVHRVALDAGSDCPNRDGTKGRGGCVYCDVEGSGTGALRQGVEIAEQLAQGLARVARRDPGCGVVAYLQSYSNTYVDAPRLEQVLSVLEPFLGEPVVALSVATRPDTLPDAALERLARVAERVPVWLELGLECADDRRLLEINRLHTVEDFLDAARRAHEHGLSVIGHAILGLPGDGREGARRTAQVLAGSAALGVKVHHLMVLRRTVLAHWWQAGRVPTLTPEVYLDWLADFVERLRPDQVLHRLTGDARAEDLLAPLWPLHKNAIREGLQLELERRGSRQGGLHQ